MLPNKNNLKQIHKSISENFKVLENSNEKIFWLGSCIIQIQHIVSEIRIFFTYIIYLNVERNINLFTTWATAYCSTYITQTEHKVNAAFLFLRLQIFLDFKNGILVFLNHTRKPKRSFKMRNTMNSSGGENIRSVC